MDDNLIETPTIVSVTASTSGFSSGFASVTILDNDTPMIRLSFAQTNLSEGAGPQATVGTVTRNSTNGGDVVIGLQSSDPSRVLVPSSVTIPTGKASASFFVSAIDNTAVDGLHNVRITPFVLASAGGTVVASGHPVTLTLLDDDGPTLKLVIAKKLVPEGQNPATTATVTRNTPATNELIVSLVSSDVNEATVPPSVTIPQGQVSAQFNIVSVNDGVTDGNKTVTITATTAGFAPGVDTLTVSDVNLPDLVVTDISTSTNVTTESYLNVTYRVANQGVTTAGSNFLTRVFLSTDPIVGNDTLLGQYTFPGTMPPGLYFSQTLPVLAPSTAGKYWIVVSTDVGDVIPEVLENNNTTVSIAPVTVTAAYGATIHADLHNAVAGTPVPMHGHATNNFGASAPFKLVNIHIGSRGTLRIISALTDARGNFSTVWQPLLNEAGHYTLGADYLGAATTVVQDEFTLYGFKANPASPSLTVADKSSITGVISLQNQSEVPLTGMAANIVSKPSNVTATLSLNTNPLAGDGTNMLGYAITANDASTTGGTVLIRVTSAEGATVDIPFAITVQALHPVLVSNPNTLYAGMIRGKQAIVTFDVINQGAAPTGPIGVSLPDAPWLRLASTNPMPPLPIGQTNQVTLQLIPANDLPLTSYRGTLVLGSDSTSVSVPFEFRNLSEGKGDLGVQAEDEFTYFAAGFPKLAGARVSLADALTGVTVATGATDTSGSFVAGQLSEGYYTLDVTADRHNPYHSTIFIGVAKTNRVSAFLSRQSVHYTWTVDEIQIEERTRITVETTFETFVPTPVIAVNPTVIDLSQLTSAGQQMQVDLKISNHGLIAAHKGRLRFATHPLYQVTPLIEDVGILPANSDLVVPLTITRLVPLTNGTAAKDRVREESISKAKDVLIVCDLPGNFDCVWTCGLNEVDNLTAILCIGLQGCHVIPNPNRSIDPDNPNAYITYVDLSPTPQCECTVDCINPGHLDVDGTPNDTVYACEGTELEFHPPTVTHKDAMVRIVCTDTAPREEPTAGTPVFKWTIIRPSPDSPISGELPQQPAKVLASRSGTYRCIFEARIDKPPCIPPPLTLPEQIANVSKIRFVTPYGDPEKQPKSSPGEGQNEFSFDDSIPGS